MSQKNRENCCYGCGANVETPGSSVVSVVNGKMVYFCSSDCREKNLDRNISLPPDSFLDSAVLIPAVKENFARNDKISEETNRAKFGEAENNFNTGKQSEQNGFTLYLPWLLQLLVVLVLPVVTFFIVDMRGDFIASGVAIVFVVTFEIWLSRVRGLSNILETVIYPIVSLMILLHFALFYIDGVSEGLFVSIAMVPSGLRALARVIEIFVRQKSSSLEFVNNINSSNWNNNSPLSRHLGKIVHILKWMRIPLSMLMGLIAFYLLNNDLPGVFLTIGIVLIVLEPRLFTMITFDSYKRVEKGVKQNGVEVNDSNVVSCVGESNIVLFQSKNTLLKNPVRVVDWKLIEGENVDKVVSALGSIENGLGDRFATGILAFIKDNYNVQYETVPVIQHTGVGVVGDTASGKTVCGSRQVMLLEGISTAEHEKWAQPIEESGRRAFFVSINNSICAMFAVEESPVMDALDSVRFLAANGYDVAMFTSAETVVANALAKRIGIDYVKSSRSDCDLEFCLSEFKLAGEKVVLVGAGAEFENNVKNSNAAIVIGNKNEKFSMAGIDAKDATVMNIASLIVMSQKALVSVRLKKATLMFFVFTCLVQSVGWSSWPMLLLISFIASLLSVLFIVNIKLGFFDKLYTIKEDVKKLFNKVINSR